MSNKIQSLQLFFIKDCISDDNQELSKRGKTLRYSRMSLGPFICWLFRTALLKEKVIKLNSTFVSNQSKRNLYFDTCQLLWLKCYRPCHAISFLIIGPINLTGLDLDLDLNCKNNTINLGSRIQI